jgi:hypothetical protein
MRPIESNRRNLRDVARWIGSGGQVSMRRSHALPRGTLGVQERPFALQKLLENDSDLARGLTEGPVFGPALCPPRSPSPLCGGGSFREKEGHGLVTSSTGDSP